MDSESNNQEQPVRRAATAAAVAALFAALGITTAVSAPARAQQQKLRHIPKVAAARPGQPSVETTPTPPAITTPNPVVLLGRMLKAEETLSYQAREATFGPVRSTEEIVKHDPARGERRESIRPEGEIYFDDFHHTWLLSRRNKQLTRSDSKVEDRNGIARIKKGKLRAEWVGVEQVAGRLADIVSVAAAAPGGMSRRFWIDQQTGLRLRSEDRGPEGRILSGSYYLTINLTPTFKPDDFTPPSTPAGFATVQETRRNFRSYDEAAKANVPVRRPTFLPLGFRLRNVAVFDRTDLAGHGTANQQRITQRFDNGLSVLTLTQTTGTVAIPKALQRTLDQSTGAGFIQLPRGQRGYVWHDQPANLTYVLMGNLPDNDLKRVAESVR